MANVTDTSDSHNEKQVSPMISTDAGMAIDVKPLAANTTCSSRDNFESAANVTDTSDAHRAKHPSQTDSIIDPIVKSVKDRKHRTKNRLESSVRMSSSKQKWRGNDENVIDPFS
jgi:hypothetical protein